ncbi:MAG: BON domain-containing protein [Rhodospirillaceae bacterium]|nr:BON domain-containing protein [Rhodospirillaceae bacterium]
MKMPFRFSALHSVVVGIAVVLGLSACSPIGVLAGVGATMGTAAVDERGVGGTASDVRIRAEINAAWVKRDAFAYSGVGLLIHEGRVVLTGTVSDETMHRDGVAMVRGVDGVGDVYDHIRVDPEAGLADYADDAGIISAMRKSIFMDKSILSLNYDIDASAHTLYLLGIAQDEGEKQRVLAHARTISGVRKITDYIRVQTRP